jgi:general secretion pathway protein B
MSLILDALKKSEAERQRQSGPTLLEVRISQPRRRYPAWVIAVGALLALNMLLLVAFMLHRPASSQAQVPQTGTAAMAPVAAASAPPVSVPPAGAPAAPSSGVASSGVASSGVVAPIAVGAQTPVLDSAANMDSGMGALQPVPRIPRPEAGGDLQDGTGNPADDEPAVPATRAAAGTERDGADHYASLPSFSDLGGDLPQLRLDLHVYAEHARDRYAMINMHRVREGDALPEGPRVLAITREGVALDYRGQEFMLRPQ